MTIAVVILAAGQGTRMNSTRQKILHHVGGKPMVQHTFEAASSIAEFPPVLVVGKGESGVKELLGSGAMYTVQPEQLGTGHATQMAKAMLIDQADQVIVTYADMPLLRAETMRNLAETQKAAGAAIALLSVEGDPASSFGRVIRDQHGRVMEIVEVSEAHQRPNTAEILATTELNAGIYCFDGDWLWQNVDKLPIRQARSGQEYYLTDMVGLAAAQGRDVVTLPIDDADECLGAGTRSELVLVERAFQRRTNQHWLDNGVTLVDPESVYIDQEVRIGQDTILWPNTYLQGKCVIGSNCVVGPNTIIRQTTLEDGCVVEQAHLEDVILPAGTHVRPFTWLHKNEAQ